MRRRRLLLGSGALALLGLAGMLVVTQLLRAGPAITPASYERIREGMTEAEVEAVLGGPPGDYTNGRYVPL